MDLDATRMKDLLYQALETENGGIAVYTTALRCVRNVDLRREWTKYLEQTRRHREIVIGLFAVMDLDAGADTCGRRAVRQIGTSLVQAMEIALKGGDAIAAEILAVECVVLAETKDRLNWKLLEACSGELSGDARSAVVAACESVEAEEDEHLHHATSWTRELWLEALGLGGVLPPADERSGGKVAIRAARAEQQRDVLHCG